MNKQTFLNLTARITDGTASDEELRIYNQYVEELKGSDTWDEIQMGEEAATRSALLVSINQEIDGRTKKSNTHKLWYKIAAAVGVLTVSISLYIFLNERNTVKEQVVNTVPQEITAANDIAPGTNKAVLTMANGESIDLESAPIGEIARDEGLQIIKTAKGVIEYKSKGIASGDLSGMHILSTPRGGIHQVILSDGSKVVLNSASTFKYPSSFVRGQKRVAELNGEAYFEVNKAVRATNKFIVLTSQQEVEVLGTHFNINNYPDEPATTTTLLEGGVRVAKLKDGGKNSLTLKPGEASVLTKRSFKIIEGNTEVIEAWQQGRFLFDDEHISSIMRKIARWYDVDAVYPVKMPKDLNFSGSISKDKKLSQILRIMELTKCVHFKISGRTLYVMSSE